MSSFVPANERRIPARTWPPIIISRVPNETTLRTVSELRLPLYQLRRSRWCTGAVAAVVPEPDAALVAAHLVVDPEPSSDTPSPVSRKGASQYGST